MGFLIEISQSTSEFAGLGDVVLFVSWSYRQCDFVQVFAGEKVQAVAFPPRADQSIGPFPFRVPSRVTLEGFEVIRRAVNDMRLRMLGPCDQVLALAGGVPAQIADESGTILICFFVHGLPEAITGFSLKFSQCLPSTDMANPAVGPG